MSGASAVLEPGMPVTVAPGGYISFEIEAGQRLRLTQPEGEQVADFISFNHDDVRELLSMHSSRAVNLSWKFTAPDTLYSNRSREMWKIEEDLTQENYCGGGFCSEHLNIARYGEAGKGAANCQSNCVVPWQQGGGSTTGNTATAANCQLTCSTQQIACQSTCARTSPSP